MKVYDQYVEFTEALYGIRRIPAFNSRGMLLNLSILSFYPPAKALFPFEFRLDILCSQRKTCIPLAALYKWYQTCCRMDVQYTLSDHVALNAPGRIRKLRTDVTFWVRRFPSQLMTPLLMIFR